MLFETRNVRQRSSFHSCKWCARSRSTHAMRVHPPSPRQPIHWALVRPTVCQLSELSEAYDITFPDIYSTAVDWFNSVQVPVTIMPFGCIAVVADSFLFSTHTIPRQQPKYPGASHVCTAQAQSVTCCGYACRAACIADFVVITVVPLALVISLMVLANAFKTHAYRRRKAGQDASTSQLIASVCSDLWFATVFLA